MNAIVQDFTRPAADTLRAFEGKPSALLHEAMNKRGALRPDIKPVVPGASFAGAALTVSGFPGDNLMLHKAVSLARPGDVLVATVREFTDAGLWGEIASVAAMERGIAALVTDGAVRDVREIAELGFPVFARGVCIQGTTKQHAGTIGRPVVLGGQRIEPGDIVVGDDDGVVVVPREEAAEVLERANAILEREAGILRALREGELTLDLLNLRPALKELGLDD